MTATSVGAWYHSLVRAPGTPPDAAFAPVWTVLYGTIGVAAWLVWRRYDIGAHRKRRALRIWGWQLLANALWPASFFGLQSPALGAVMILVLLAGIAATILAFWPLQKAAALLLLPYAAWVSYASYVNIAFWWLNRS